MDDAQPIHPDWVVTRPILSGVCGSDAKLVLGDFDDGDIDNPMAAFSSLPHVPGHEVVAEVVALGPGGPGRRGRPAGGAQPVAELRPPRASRPLCPPCRAGDLNLCWSFTKGDISPGRPHRRGHRSARGLGRADGRPLLDAHPGARRHLRRGRGAGRPLLGLLPRHRPQPPTARREGAWSTAPGRSGLASVAILTALYPEVEVAVVARFPAQAEMARQFGASAGRRPRAAPGAGRGPGRVVGGVLHQAFDGLPMAHPGHIDVVYDSVAKPETFEVGVRVLAERGRWSTPGWPSRAGGSGPPSTSRS